MAFPRGEDLKNATVSFRIPPMDALKNSSACSTLLLRGFSVNFVNMLFPACFNCLQKCYYVPYSLLFISNIFLGNQILILHCAFFYVTCGGFRSSGAPSSDVAAEWSRSPVSSLGLLPCFHVFFLSSLSLLTSCHSLWILFPAVLLLWGFVLERTSVWWVLNIRGAQTPRPFQIWPLTTSGVCEEVNTVLRWTSGEDKEHLRCSLDAGCFSACSPFSTGVAAIKSLICGWFVLTLFPSHF